MTEYKKALLLFEKYKEDKKAYEAKLAEYNLALDEYDRYTTELDKYEDYLDELEEYNTQLSAYKKYVSDHTKYTQNKKKYEAYINSLTKYRVAMATMENVFLVSESGHCMVNTLNGDTVDTVVAHKDELVKAGAEMVDRMSMRRNEWRDWMGLPPDPDMDELLALENYIPADRLGDQNKLS